MFKIIPIILIILFIAIAYWGCGNTSTLADVNCSNTSAKIYFTSDNPTLGSTGIAANFKIHYILCADYASGYIQLIAYNTDNGTSALSFKYYFPGSPTEVDYIFPYYFTTSGHYTMDARLYKSDGVNYIHTDGTKININGGTQNTFKIKELAMAGDDLWLNDNTNGYIGVNKRNQAWATANTVFSSENPITGLDVTNCITSLNDLYSWTLTNAYGNPIPGNIHPEITIICGIDDIDKNVFLNDDPLTIMARNIPGDATFPPRAYILNSRIRDHYSLTHTPPWTEYDRIRYTVGSAIHELGHCRGIMGDDIYNNIAPKHSGENSDNCLMRTPNDAQTFTNPVFCAGHIFYLQGIF
jgi:hypothetical protein